MSKGGKLARSAAMLCNETRFQQWLDRKRSLVHGTHDASKAAEWMRDACKVKSRAEIDHNEYAGKMFNKIMRTYLYEVSKWQ